MVFLDLFYWWCYLLLKYQEVFPLMLFCLYLVCINNHNLFIGQKDYLETKEKDFKILKIIKRKILMILMQILKKEKITSFI